MKSGIRLLAFSCTFAAVVFGQATSFLQLSSGTATSGATVPLYISLTSSSTNQPVAMQWDLITPLSVIATNTIAGAVATAAGKSLVCSGNRCILEGMNSAPIAGGVVAIVNVTLSPQARGTSTIQLNNLFAAAADSTSLPISAGSGIVSVSSPINVMVSPFSASLLIGQSQQLTASVTGGAGNTAVTWSLSPNVGNIGSSGVYTAPTTITTLQTVTASATSVADPTASASATITLMPLVVSAVFDHPITASTATITWETNEPSTSQVVYGTDSTYGFTSVLDATLTTSHAVSLTGLSATTIYHYQVQSQDKQSNVVSSSDFTFSTGLPALMIHADASEVSGLTNGSIVTPGMGPVGFRGHLVVQGAGSVNYAAGQTGTGVYFVNCCVHANNAYYKFAGTSVGNVFNVTQGQISFYLKSRYSFSERLSNAAAPRYTFDVRDGSDKHLFFFYTKTTSTALMFTYASGGTAQYYFVPQGTEDTLFGRGVVLRVKLTWNRGILNLYLNDTLAKSTTYALGTPNWSAASNFDLGAYEYSTVGGYNTSDDVIDEFIVTRAMASPVTPPVVSIMAPTNGASVAGTMTISANATGNVGITGVQFKLDGMGLGSAGTTTGSNYSMSWDTTTTTNGPHTVYAVANDATGNSATASVSVTVNNPAPVPVTVSVNPASASLSGGQSQQLTASITGGPGNTTVTWSLSPNVGTISSSGVYTAPATITTLQTVTASATSVADSTKLASATITLLAPVVVSVNPASASLSGGQSQQLIASITGGAGNTTVTWSLSPNVGTISSSGVYTAPATITTLQSVTASATSVADSTKFASSSITLQARTMIPARAALGAFHSQQFTAILDGLITTNVKWSVMPAIGRISPSGLYIAPSIITTTASIQVTATSIADSTKTVLGIISLVPSTSLPAGITLGPAEHVQFSARFSNISVNTATWSITPALGTISPVTGLYIAPAEITEPIRITVTAASLVDPQRFASAIVTLTPFTVFPAQTRLAAAHLQPFAVHGLSGPVDWSVNPADAGNLSAEGVYTAPAYVSSAQTVIVTATSTSEPGKFASAVITLMPTVLNPDVAVLSPAQTQQFMVFGADGSVLASNFSLTPPVGSISSTGRYTAPPTSATAQIVTVIASQPGELINAGSSRVTLFPSVPQLLDFQCTTTQYIAQCTITLTAPAPATGLDVTLASNPKEGINGPASWHMAAGDLFSTLPVTIISPGTIFTATLGTSVSVTLYPAP